MPFLISDSSVLIDCIDGGLIRSLFQLPERFATPQALFVEELETRYPDLPTLGLQLVDYSGADWIAGIQHYQRCYRGPSALDLLALLIAQQMHCTLLTGDKKLRQAALQEGVTVHGTLYLVERLFTANLAPLAEIEAAYVRMQQAGSRLPWDEIQRQLAKLRHQNTG